MRNPILGPRGRYGRKKTARLMTSPASLTPYSRFAHPLDDARGRGHQFRKTGPDAATGAAGRTRHRLCDARRSVVELCLGGNDCRDWRKADPVMGCRSGPTASLWGSRVNPHIRFRSNNLSFCESRAVGRPPARFQPGASNAGTRESLGRLPRLASAYQSPFRHL